MNPVHLIDKLPIWGVFFTTFLVVILSMESGFRLGKRGLRRSNGSGKIRSGPVVASSLGLLAFILAFAFGAVASRLEERKQLVLAEANAVGTAYLRAELLPEAECVEIQRILRDYVAQRIKAVQTDSLMTVNEAIRKSTEMHDELWSKAVAIGEQSPTPITALFLQSLNDVIDLHLKRVIVGLFYRMPTIFWVATYLLAVVAMMVAGYDVGASSGGRSVTIFVAGTFAFSLVLTLVVTLDRPWQGLSSISQQAMISLEQSMRQSAE